MKIQFLKEGYFKNTEEIKNSVENNKSKTSAERALSLGRSQIQLLASKRFDTEFKELVNGKANSIFGKTNNGITIESIKYFFDGNTLICEFHIGVENSGTRLVSGSAELIICYPENIVEIEKSLNEEYNCDAKAKFIFEKTSERANSVFRTDGLTTMSIGIVKTLQLLVSDCTDLTEFCYFLNSCEGIDFSDYTLKIENLKEGLLLTNTDSKIDLNTKFEAIHLHNFWPNEVKLKKILSNKIIRDRFAARIGYQGRWADTKKFIGEEITGYVIIYTPISKNDLRDIETFLDMILVFQEMAENMKEYSNIYIRWFLPNHAAWVDYKNCSLLCYLNEFLEYNYEEANRCGFHISDPLNMTLSLELANSNFKLGIFPYLDYHDLGSLGGEVKRSLKK